MNDNEQNDSGSSNSKRVFFTTTVALGLAAILVAYQNFMVPPRIYPSHPVNSGEREFIQNRCNSNLVRAQRRIQDLHSQIKEFEGDLSQLKLNMWRLRNGYTRLYRVGTKCRHYLEKLSSDSETARCMEDYAQMRRQSENIYRASQSMTAGAKVEQTWTRIDQLLDENSTYCHQFAMAPIPSE